MLVRCQHRFVVGPENKGLYAFCVKCKATYHVLTLQTLVEIGAARIEEGQIKFTLDKRVETFLSPEIRIEAE